MTPINSLTISFFIVFCFCRSLSHFILRPEAPPELAGRISGSADRRNRYFRNQARASPAVPACAIRTPGSLSLHDTRHRQTARPAIDRAVFFPSFSHPYKDASSASNKSFRIRRIRNERFLILHRTKNSRAA
ncbi:MAG TPA: hypothetical protein IAA50_06680 [Candidatus Alistipes pullistercoris]|jgi:hypothetical protein|nr:hypothetical protein [Candidatus Alistipes pullistercoris]